MKILTILSVLTACFGLAIGIQTLGCSSGDGGKTYLDNDLIGPPIDRGEALDLLEQLSDPQGVVTEASIGEVLKTAFEGIPWLMFSGKARKTLNPLCGIAEEMLCTEGGVIECEEYGLEGAATVTDCTDGYILIDGQLTWVFDPTLDFVTMQGEDLTYIEGEKDCIVGGWGTLLYPIGEDLFITYAYTMTCDGESIPYSGGFAIVEGEEYAFHLGEGGVLLTFIVEGDAVTITGDCSVTLQADRDNCTWEVTATDCTSVEVGDTGTWPCG